jgi:hypothetical protein
MLDRGCARSGGRALVVPDPSRRVQRPQAFRGSSSRRSDRAQYPVQQARGFGRERDFRAAAGPRRSAARSLIRSPTRAWTSCRSSFLSANGGSAGFRKRPAIPSSSTGRAAGLSRRWPSAPRTEGPCRFMNWNGSTARSSRPPNPLSPAKADARTIAARIRAEPSPAAAA